MPWPLVEPVHTAVQQQEPEAALIADLSGELGLALPAIAPATLAAMRPAFPDHSTIANPVDAWGLGFNADRVRIVLDALIAGLKRRGLCFATIPEHPDPRGAAG